MMNTSSNSSSLNTPVPTEAFISLEKISKKFPGVLALDNVSLTLNKGEVHCLAGQNGCGKSTIIKVISGVYHPEKGANITLDGKLFHTLTPQLSSYYGIQVIYQDLSLFPNLSVAENIAIHRYLPGGDFWVKARKSTRLNSSHITNS